MLPIDREISSMPSTLVLVCGSECELMFRIHGFSSRKFPERRTSLLKTCHVEMRLDLFAFQLLETG